MTPCFAAEFETPDRHVLRGLWFGPRRPKRAIVWVHGLGSSMFSKLRIVESVIDTTTAVLVFNNRGHDKVATVPQAGRRGKALQAGSAHEIFTDCVDDIQGALAFVRRQGVKDVYLAGHSTGCQKSVYWAHMKSRGVKGVVLLAPISDYSALRLARGEKHVARAVARARKLVRQREGSRLLLGDAWGGPWLSDAQRFVSLYSGESAEELFPYWSARRPRALARIKLPILVILAGADEYGDRPAKTLADWFDDNINSEHGVVIIPGATHGFRGHERAVARSIRAFIGR